jgi:hypothetical protein
VETDSTSSVIIQFYLPKVNPRHNVEILGKWQGYSENKLFILLRISLKIKKIENCLLNNVKDVSS